MTDDAQQPRNPYRTKDGRVWLRASWVAFLDILGFIDSIRKVAISGTQEQHLNELRAALKEAKQDFIEASDRKARQRLNLPAPHVVKVFTDNVVLGFPILDDGETEFGSMISIVGRYQYTLLKHGFFVRGGIAFGDLYIDDDVVYGNGLLDAYEAEHALARDPRIVLGPTAMSQVHTHLAWYSDVAVAPHDEHLLVDSDSQMFVNYLAIPIDGLDNPQALPGEYLQDLERHRELIISRLKEFSNLPAYWSKYAWAGAYHNYFCCDFLAHAQLAIPPDLLKQAPRRLSAVYQRRGSTIVRGGEVVGKFKSMLDFKKHIEPK